MKELVPFAWPLAVLILAVVTVFVFRAPLTRLIDRADGLKVSKSGISIDPAAASAVTSAQTEAKPVERGLEIDTEEHRKIDTARRPSISPLVLEQERGIRRDLAKLQLKEKSDEAINVLIEHLARISHTGFDFRATTG